ncbi:DNA-binding MarR family transcriptional regulator [Nocardia transvalensis]|uniref:DNA-binding MarR family transcriptional regulator n=1 Tax=Nocardia transvalensis TaxID=37333 RepID=A0A7W9PN99_9NOCA|nr:hypothetical protein [Nocardia transvalensis]MBB5918809.1 DNA-binding MarR family transcriptional regulator [Nocardia transvalensis]
MLTLTGRGRELLADCARLARLMDEELAAELAAHDRATLLRTLGVLATDAGLPIAGVPGQKHAGKM